MSGTKLGTWHLALTPEQVASPLLSRYAKCLDGRQDVANRRIAELLGGDDGQETGTRTRPDLDRPALDPPA
ncbi:hypothetical protein [Streptomyces sp. SP17KL33]|uniref:hypothetical protein n=1 Tax=Streptomyces sp. SP17KL33 TaxID=3002534 RepID=UPI002E75FF9F|nr:hypothetical protein [Streptomyces sp. SP17KL33]MEE1833597.1 hypothetical protein [Streptomyces sp. SP17KL33]